MGYWQIPEFRSQMPLQQSLSAAQNPLPLGMQPQLPSLAQKSEQQSPSVEQGLLSGTQAPTQTPLLQLLPPQSTPQAPQLTGS